MQDLECANVTMSFVNVGHDTTSIICNLPAGGSGRVQITVAALGVESNPSELAYLSEYDPTISTADCDGTDCMSLGTIETTPVTVTLTVRSCVAGSSATYVRLRQLSKPGRQVVLTLSILKLTPKYGPDDACRVSALVGLRNLYTSGAPDATQFSGPRQKSSASSGSQAASRSTTWSRCRQLTPVYGAGETWLQMSPA